MADPSPAQQDWTGISAFVMSIGAVAAGFFRRGVTKHYVVNEIHPVATRVSVLESQYHEITRRLGSIDEKLDAALKR